jgi:serine protease Do
MDNRHRECYRSADIIIGTKLEHLHKNNKKFFMSHVLAFLLGVVIIFGCVYLADRMNLFTGNQPITSVQLGNSTTTVDNTIVHATDRFIQSGTIADMAGQANPAVVLIQSFVSEGSSFRFDDPFFRFFFEAPSHREQPNQQGRNNMIQQGAGSGFFIRTPAIY